MRLCFTTHYTMRYAHCPAKQAPEHICTYVPRDKLNYTQSVDVADKKEDDEDGSPEWKWRRMEMIRLLHPHRLNSLPSPPTPLCVRTSPWLEMMRTRYIYIAINCYIPWKRIEYELFRLCQSERFNQWKRPRRPFLNKFAIELASPGLSFLINLSVNEW